MIYVRDSDTGEEIEVTLYRYEYSQSLDSLDDRTVDFIFQMEFTDYDPSTPAVADITGRYSHDYLTKLEPSYLRLMNKREGSWLRFVPCTFFGREAEIHGTQVTWSDGEIVLDVDMAPELPFNGGTEPSVFARAQGKLNGISFDQKDYWKLIYMPEHHHFVRHFLVRFDAPIGDACGLKVFGVDPAESPNAPELVSITAVDCDDNDLTQWNADSVSKI